MYRLLSTDQQLYLFAGRQEGVTTVYGGLKVGKKRLFIRTVSGWSNHMVCMPPPTPFAPYNVFFFLFHTACRGAP